MKGAGEQDAPVIEGPAVLRRRRLWRSAFWVYAAALFTATHWPRLEVPAPEGGDKVIHVIAFGGWTLFAAALGWFGPRLSLKNIFATVALAAVYAAIDEGFQAFEFIHRTASLADYSANAIGIGLAAVILLLSRLRTPRAAGEPS